MDLAKWKKEIIKFFYNYDEKLRTPFKVGLFFFEFAVWAYLIIYIVASTEFRTTKECVELTPLIEGLKNGTLRVETVKPLGWNFTGTLPIPGPIQPLKDSLLNP